MSQLVLAEESFNLVHVALAHKVQNLGELGGAFDLGEGSAPLWQKSLIQLDT